jgi:hypothetical protein
MRGTPLTGTTCIKKSCYWLNQRVRRNQWLPMQQELEALLNVGQPVLPPEPTKKNIMTTTTLIGIALISLGAIVLVRGRAPKAPATEYSDPVVQILENIRVKHNFPALATAVVIDGKIVVTSAVGFRKNGGTEKVSVEHDVLRRRLDGAGQKLRRGCRIQRWGG